MYIMQKDSFLLRFFGLTVMSNLQFPTIITERIVLEARAEAQGMEGTTEAANEKNLQSTLVQRL